MAKTNKQTTPDEKQASQTTETPADKTVQQIIEEAKKAAVEIAVKVATETAEKTVKDVRGDLEKVATETAEKTVQQTIGNAVAEAAKNATQHQPVETTSSEPLVKVKFIKSPFGKFKLPYYVGQEKELPKPLAGDLIKAQVAEKV